MSRPKRSVRTSAIEADEDEPIVSTPPPPAKDFLPAGIPPFLAQAVRPAAPARSTVSPFARRFRIPPSFLSHEWEKSGRPESDQAFSLRGLTPEIEHKSAEVAGVSGSVISMVQHQVLLCVCKIGDELTNQNHSKTTSWMHDIGAKGRSCVMRAFNKMNSVSEDEFSTFLETEEADFDF